MSKFQQETGIDLAPRRTMFLPRVPPMDEGNYLNRLFINLYRALGQANTRPKNFEAILRGTSLNDEAFYLPKYVESTIRPVLANLRTLFLDLDSGPCCVHIDSNNSIG